MGEIPDVAVCAALSRLVHFTVVPTEMVKLSKAKSSIPETLVSPPERAPGVGVGTPLEPPLEPPPVNGVGLGVGNLVAVGRTTVARTWGIGVAVANSDLVAGTNGVGVELTIRVAVGAILRVGVGAPLTVVGAATRVAVAMGGRVACATALGVLVAVTAAVVAVALWVSVAVTAPVVGAGAVGSLVDPQAIPAIRPRVNGTLISARRQKTGLDRGFGAPV